MDFPEKIRALNTQAMELQQTDPASAVALCHEIINQSSRLGEQTPEFEDELAQTYAILGGSERARGNLSDALEAYTRALALIEETGDQTQTYKILLNTGSVQGQLTNYAEALETQFRALDIAHTLKDSRREAETLNDIGYTYIVLEQYTKALTYLNKGLEILQKSEHKDLLSYTLDSLCNACQNVGEYDKALEYGKRALKLSKQIGNKSCQAEHLISLGKAYLKMGNAAEAMRQFQAALEIANQDDYAPAVSLAHHHIGLLLTELQQFKQSQEHLEAALSEMYKLSGDYKLALMHHEQYHQIKEGVFDTESRNQIHSIEIIHQLEAARKDAEIYRLRNVELIEEIKRRKQAEEGLKRVAILDPLTSLYNRRYFIAQAKNEITRSIRYPHPIALFMLDIDHFKRVNDKYGHLIGDEVLIEIANRIRRSVRKADIPGRYGGEEFVVLLPETGLEEARQAAERLSESITTKPTNTSKLTVLVTVSIGVACMYKGESLTVNELIERADLALYHAKQKGRNRVESYSEELQRE
jgi:diguanylate cyclase (GGDEF)-like protein